MSILKDRDIQGLTGTCKHKYTLKATNVEQLIQQNNCTLDAMRLVWEEPESLEDKQG